MKFISNENVCVACHISSAWQFVVWWIFSKTKEDIRLHSETQAWMRYHHLKRYVRYMYMYTLQQNFNLQPLNFCFPWIYVIYLWYLLKGCKINVKISLNLCILIFAFSTIVHLNFEVLMTEIPMILCAFPYVKLLTIKCYDWSSKWAIKCALLLLWEWIQPEKNKCWKHSNPSQTIPLMFELL